MFLPSTANPNHVLSNTQEQLNIFKKYLQCISLSCNVSHISKYWASKSKVSQITSEIRLQVNYRLIRLSFWKIRCAQSLGILLNLWTTSLKIALPSPPSLFHLKSQSRLFLCSNLEYASHNLCQICHEASTWFCLVALLTKIMRCILQVRAQEQPHYPSFGRI